MSGIVDQLESMDLSFSAEAARIDLNAPIQQNFVQDGDYYTTDDEDGDDYDSEDSLDHELQLINAQLQWEESLSQIKLLLNIVILPVIGKALGRKMAGFG